MIKKERKEGKQNTRRHNGYIVFQYTRGWKFFKKEDDTQKGKAYMHFIQETKVQVVNDHIVAGLWINKEVNWSAKGA